MKAQNTNTAIKRLTTMLYLTIALLGGGFIVNAIMYNKIVSTLSESIWFRSGEQVYKGVRTDNYDVDEVEIRSHSKLFYSYMFSFGVDSYNDNLKYAKDNLIDVQTGRVIENRFQEQKLYDKLLNTNSEIATILDSASINLDSYPYVVTAYCTQYIYNSTGKSDLPFVNSFDVYKMDKRTDENPHGLQIRNWKNVRVEN